MPVPDRPVLPWALAPGDGIALVAPSSPLAEPALLDFACEQVRHLGFRPVPFARADAVHGYLAGTDEERAHGLRAAFLDPATRAVWCLRGGFGALRLLARLDLAELAATRKPLLGYSDATALFGAFAARTGLVVLHGPIATQALSPGVAAELVRALTSTEPLGVLAAWPSANAPVLRPRLQTIVPGVAEGQLFGGNLSVFAKLVGTPYLPDLDGAILVLEDVGEATYRLDGLLQQLWLAGVFDRVAGVALGQFTNIERSGNLADLSLEAMLREVLGRVPAPVLAGLRVGHIPEAGILPLGVRVRLDADAGTLVALEPALAPRA